MSLLEESTLRAALDYERQHAKQVHAAMQTMSEENKSLRQTIIALKRTALALKELVDSLRREALVMPYCPICVAHDCVCAQSGAGWEGQAFC